MIEMETESERGVVAKGVGLANSVGDPVPSRLALFVQGSRSFTEFRRTLQQKIRDGQKLLATMRNARKTVSTLLRKKKNSLFFYILVIII